MKAYTYFPGCSLDATAAPYGKSIEAVAKALELEFEELDDWNCCGSTPSDATGALTSLCLGARNLSLAEKTGRADLVTPCSSCFTSLNRVNDHLKRYPEQGRKVKTILNEVGLDYRGTTRVRHLLEVILTDIELDAVREKVVLPLRGLKVAPYYGCQLVRPANDFDDPEYPHSLHNLIQALGGEPASFPLATRCCGASLIISQPDFAMSLVNKILQSADKAGAECVITPCPLCQTNLDAYQSVINTRLKAKHRMPILFFTQLVGLALGLDPTALGVGEVVTSPKRVVNQVYER